MAAHAPPFYCPYCGDEDIRPFGEKHGDWRCGACRRVWTLRYVGLARPESARPESARPESADQGMSTPVGGLEQA
jgi:transposase-like protein